MSDKLMTVEQMAEYLQVDEYTIYAWARKGEIPAFKVGRFWRFRKEDIDKWLESRMNKSEKTGDERKSNKHKNGQDDV